MTDCSGDACINRLVLVGNGFDIANGFGTSYANFIQWYWNKLKQRIMIPQKQTEEGFVICHDYYSNPLIRIVIRNSSCSLSDYVTRNYPEWNADGDCMSFYRDIVRDRNLVVTLCPFFKSICDTSEELKWFDIEQIYFDSVCKLKSGDVNGLDSLNAQIDYLKRHLIIWLSVMNVDRVHMINSRVRDYILRDVDTNVLPRNFCKKGSVNLGNVFILNFNYTTFLDHYISNSMSAELYAGKIRMLHIHGMVQDMRERNGVRTLFTESDNIQILSYDNDLDPRTEEVVRKFGDKFVNCRKTALYERYYKQSYSNLISFLKSDYMVDIMGLSCGASDRSLLNRIFENRHCVCITPFYHCYKDNGDNYDDMVRNIRNSFRNSEMADEKICVKKMCHEMPQL